MNPNSRYSRRLRYWAGKLELHAGQMAMHHRDSSEYARNFYGVRNVASNLHKIAIEIHVAAPPKGVHESDGS